MWITRRRSDRAAAATFPEVTGLRVSQIYIISCIYFHCSGRDDMERYGGNNQKEQGHETRNAASPVDHTRSPGLLTWSEIWCDVDNSKRFRSGCSCHVSQGHRLKGVAALHNLLAFIFHCSGRDDMERYVRKHQEEPGHHTRDTASPVDNVRSPGDSVTLRSDAGADGEMREREQCPRDAPAIAPAIVIRRLMCDAVLPPDVRQVV